MLVGKANLGVIGERTEKVLSLANESDTNKTDVLAGEKTLFYDVADDISFVYINKPLLHKSGIPHSYKFHVGQKVVVAGYSNHKFETREAHIIGSNMPLVMGQAQLRENLVLDVHLDPGTSGSAVLDEQGHLLGMIVLSGALKLRSGDLTASLALPVRTIAKALMKLDPSLGLATFSDMPEEEPRQIGMPSVVFQESDLPEDTSSVIPTQSAVPNDVPDPVGKLHIKSEAAARLMVNFVTKQCLVQGTQKPLCHELSVVDGQQIFREIYKNDKLGRPTAVFPVRKHGVWTQSDWADTLREIAENPWVFQGSVNDQYLFTFKSTAEDDRCYWEEYSQGIPLFGGGHAPWKGPVLCFEQVLTDKSFNVLSVFTEMRPPDDCLTQLFQAAVYFNWIKLRGLSSPVLLPVMERVTAKVLGQKELWYANVSWTDYQKFRVEHKITVVKKENPHCEMAALDTTKNMDEPGCVTH